ncbi:hypothetical protein O9X98_08690 [Agrobacterium salinitolerans]|nr:hypothetical protein [Agrobacterium salinitolerans]
MDLEAVAVPDYVLFLDDERDPPKSADVWNKQVVHAKNIREFIAAIETRGEPFMIMFDWYLGSGEPDGLEAARWLVSYDLQHNILTEGLMFDSQSSDRQKARDIVRLIANHLATKFSKDDPDDVIRSARRRVPSVARPVPRRLRF